MSKGQGHGGARNYLILILKIRGAALWLETTLFPTPHSHILYMCFHDVRLQYFCVYTTNFSAHDEITSRTVRQKNETALVCNLALGQNYDELLHYKL